MLVIYFLFPFLMRHPPPRNDKDKVPDILQQRKGDIQFCHRFPVRCLWCDLTGVRKRTSPATIESPRRGFSQNPCGISQSQSHA